MVRTQKSRMGLGMALVIVVAILGSLAQGQDAEVLYLDGVADLDLGGEIIYAVNFGNNGSPVVAGVVFSPHKECSGLTIEAATQLEEAAVATWWGSSPSTDDAGLDQLLNSMVATWTQPYEITVDAEGLVPGNSYRLQLMGYEPENHGRNIDIIVENKQIVTGLSPINVQGGVVGQGGFLVTYEFTATDSTLNVLMLNHQNACGLCGLLLKMPETVTTFSDYGSGTTTQLFAGGATWQLNWGQGPWTWSEGTDQPLLDSNVSAVLDLRTTAAADISNDLVATLPIGGTLTVSAHDPNNKNVVIGTMALSGTGVNIIDINASRVIVDEGSGMFLAPFHAPDPRLTMTLDKATGVFAYINPIEDWEMCFAGSYAIPLMKGVPLQVNILDALGGNVPLIGGIGEFTLTGQYEPDESKRPQRFCEYGTGFALRFGTDGGLWEQDWTGGPWDWHQCAAVENVTFLGDNVSGELETVTVSAPVIDENLILKTNLTGTMTLTDYSETEPDVINGQIAGDVEGTFVADINAEHATFDADGNILLAFGASIIDAPDVLMTVTEATGTYADIRQAGQWAWYVNGTITLARVPDLTLQDNILAALQNGDLLLGAQEEFVLTGWYYRDASEE